MIIQPSFGGCLRHRITIPIDKTTVHRYAPTCGASQKTILHWHASTAQWIAKNRRRAVSYVSTGLARLHRDTGGTRNYRRRAVVERCSRMVTKKAPLGLLQGALRKGAATYSPGLPVPSAWRGLTSLFGMGRGGTPAL